MPQIPHPPRTQRAAARAAARAALAAVVGGCLVTGAAQAAVVDLKPYALYSWESDHNPFLAPDANTGTPLVTRPNVDDKVSTLVAGLDVNHSAAETSTYLRAEGRRVAYSTYDTFNHTEYTATVGHKRGLETGNQFGIELGAARQFTPFDVLAADTPIAYQTRHYGRLVGMLHVANRNLFDASFERSYLRLPTAGASDFNSTESDLHLGYGRLIGDAVTVGARAMGVAGSNFGGGASTQFKQLTPELYLKYNRADVMQFDAAIGATHRTQEGSPGMKATVGNANLQYNLTSKTGLRLGILRQVSGYYVVGGSQTTTAYTAGVDWHPTDRFSMVLDAGRTHGLYESPDVAISRIDDADLGQLTASWKPIRFLTVSAYGQVQRRASTSVDSRFDANSVGISVKLQRP